MHVSGIYMIFDYFKEAFHINRSNKILYKPQIVLILLRSLAILLMGGYLYSWITKPSNLNSIRNEDFSFLFTGLGIFVGLMILVVVVLGVLSLIVEAGLLNMYKVGVLSESVTMNNFWEGVNKYFFKLIAGYLLIMVGLLAILLGGIIVSIFTLGIGLILILMISSIIVLLIQLFLSIWKVSLVMDDKGVMDAFKDSFRFVKDNLWSIFVLQIIHWSFSGGSRGMGSNLNFPKSSGQNGRDASNIIPRAGNEFIPNKDDAINNVMKVLKIGVAIAVPTITVISAIAMLIGMIFEVFFSLSLFIAYKYQFKQPINPQEEVTL